MLTIFGSHGLNSHADICTCVSLETLYKDTYSGRERTYIFLWLHAFISQSLRFVVVFFFVFHLVAVAAAACCLYYVHISRFDSSFFFASLSFQFSFVLCVPHHYITLIFIRLRALSRCSY